MEKVLAIVFDDKQTACEGASALEQLDENGEISLHEIAIITKRNDGSVHIEREVNHESPARLMGPVVWGLYGLLGGPINAGSLIGGALLASISDMEDAGISKGFVKDIARALTPGSAVLIADVMEERVTPVDRRMEVLGGIVFRRTRDRIGTTEEDRDADAFTIQLDQLKGEWADARDTHHRAKLDAKIQELRLKLENTIERRRVKAELRHRERERKIRTLQQKVASSKGEIRNRHLNRISDLLED